MKRHFNCNVPPIFYYLNNVEFFRLPIVLIRLFFRKERKTKELFFFVNNIRRSSNIYIQKSRDKNYNHLFTRASINIQNIIYYYYYIVPRRTL